MSHPSHILGHLARAFSETRSQIDAATARGDTRGAGAWEIVLRAIENVEKAVARARPEQDWHLRPGYLQAQPKPLPCFACAGVKTEEHAEHCGWTP